MTPLGPFIQSAAALLGKSCLRTIEANLPLKSNIRNIMNSSKSVRMDKENLPQEPQRFTSTLPLAESSDSFLKGRDERQIELMKEEVIVVDQNDKVIGARSKYDAHLMSNINAGLAHRAFSVLLFNSRNELLLTQRSDAKITFPSYWTNTCCSHPLHIPEELEMNPDVIGVRRAAIRRLVLELGVPSEVIPLDEIDYMTRFKYMAPSDCGVWGEHEIDYVLIIQNRDFPLAPDPNEVKAVRYLGRNELDSFLNELREEGSKVTPWFRTIVEKLLYPYWDNLERLEELKDHKTIHCF